ncbi:MAG: hypothetical protein HKO66_09390 [Saprospiraceae bacterium]|nr:hypothetical protein [Bacteroidia bacterium]NNE14949.1 hypothetical protein [Saprospiraceae bacterium]NNL92431.1 hypothetical protein [Saprospiraceae bacterium]
MFFIYTLFIRVYYCIIFFGSFFNKKAKYWIEGRKNQIEKITPTIKQWSENKIIWIHAASYGEFEMSRPLIESLVTKNDQLRFVISFYSPSGYNNIHLDPNLFLKIYLPLDIKSHYIPLLKLINPKTIIFIKYEFWFNFLRILNKMEIPYCYTSLHLRKNSYLFNPLFRSFKSLLQNAKYIFCHSTLSQNILDENGFKNLKLLGDSRVRQAVENKEKNVGHLSWKVKRPVIVFGSMTDKEWPFIKKLINNEVNFNFIIAPHDVTIEIKNKFDAINEEVSYYSEGGEGNQRILIVDTYGDLRYLYRFGDIAYVGAGFEKGPHNLIEPLVYKIPIVCGPNIRKFPMAVKLKEERILKVLSNKSDILGIPELLVKINKAQYHLKVDNFFENESNNLDEFSDLILNLL